MLVWVINIMRLCWCRCFVRWVVVELFWVDLIVLVNVVVWMVEFGCYVEELVVEIEFLVIWLYVMWMGEGVVVYVEV